MPDLVADFASACAGHPVLAEPNAGPPKLVNAKTVYEPIPDVEKYFEAMIANGANIVGGCCGTTPDYIRRLRAVVDAANANKA
jgi:5-methyltetrahydrofolate--homocysteine methyltransferase